LKSVYIKPVGGLANRIRVIESGLNLCVKIKAELIVLWELNDNLNARFDHLFEPDSRFTVIHLNPGLNFGRSGLLRYFPDKKPSGWRQIVYALSKKIARIRGEIWYDDLHEIFKDLHPIYHPDSGLNQTGIAIKAQSKIDKLLTPHLNKGETFYLSSSWKISLNNETQLKLKPIPRLHSRIDSVEIDKENTVGFHIRRTDHEWSKSHSGIEKFKAAMQLEISANEQVKFFVATDSPEVLTELKEAFAGRISHVVHQTMNRNLSEGIDSAIIDLYCLARCSKIYGSYLSTFSELAGQIGDIEVHEAK
jgi:hypothetical protein